MNKDFRVKVGDHPAQVKTGKSVTIEFSDTGDLDNDEGVIVCLSTSGISADFVSSEGERGLSAEITMVQLEALARGELVLALAVEVHGETKPVADVAF